MAHDPAYHRAYMRRWRAAQALPVPELEWPKNLYGHPIAIEDLLRADATYKPPPIGKVVKEKDTCHECKQQPPKDTIFSTQRSEHGGGWNIFYFCSHKCQATWKGRK